MKHPKALLAQNRKYHAIICIALLLLLASAIPALAVWDIFGPDIRITDSAGDSLFPSLVWTGTEYGVSWQERRDGNDEIYFAQLDMNGVKIGGDVRITNDGAISERPSLVWSGTEYGVSWQDNRDGNYEIYFALIDANGVKIGPDVRITNDGAISQRPSVVWTGIEYGVSWMDNRDGNYEIYFAQIGMTGAKIGSDVRITNDANYSEYPSLAWAGMEYGVSWEDNRDGNDQIYLARIDSTGIKIGTDARISNDLYTPQRPSLVGTNTEYGVCWHNSRASGEIYFARIDSTGTKIGADIRITNDANTSNYPSLKWTGSEYGVSWQDRRVGGGWDVLFARIDSTGAKIGADIRIVNESTNSSNPSLVWSGTEYGVSWQDDRDGNVEIYFGQLTWSAVFGTISPASANPGTTLDVTILGIDTNFIDGISSVTFSGGYISVLNITVISATQLQTTITIDSLAGSNPSDVTVTTGGEVVSKSNAFRVVETLSPPYIPMTSNTIFVFLAVALGIILMRKASHRRVSKA